MKTIESAVIFPFTLSIFVMIIFLCFDLHDKILSQAASYKYLVHTNNENSNLSALNSYVDKFSLSNKDYSFEHEDDCIDISSQNYNNHVYFFNYDKCDLLRKSTVTANIINSITN